MFDLEIINIQVAFESMRVDEVPGRMCRVRRDQSPEQNTEILKSRSQ